MVVITLFHAYHPMAGEADQRAGLWKGFNIIQICDEAALSQYTMENLAFY